MAWMLSRVLMLVLGTGIAGGLGYWLGEWMQMPHLAALDLQAEAEKLGYATLVAEGSAIVMSPATMSAALLGA